MMNLFLSECHKNDRDEEVQYDKGHEHNAGANQEGPKQWVIIQNLRNQKERKHR